MIDCGLDTNYNGEEQKEVDFSPVPAGEYKVKVKKIDPWKESTKDVKNYLKDEKGNAILDEKGQKKFEMIKGCKFYNANMQLEILEGEYKDRIIFHTLTTHPNMNYTIKAFLYAIGIESMKVSEIPEKCIDEELIIKVAIDTYKKQITDKNTGMMDFKTVEKNVVKSLKPIEKDSILKKDKNIVDFDEIK